VVGRVAATAAGSRGAAGYLATTLRRPAARAWRGGPRRAERGRDFAHDEALPSSATLAGAMEQHQRVVAALLQLGEPTQTALLVRFLEDPPPRPFVPAD